MSTNFNKPLVALILGIIAAILGAILSAQGPTGLSPMAVTWIGIAVSAVSAIGAAIAGNAFQPTVPPGHVVVPASSVKPEAANTVIFKRSA